MSVQLMGKLGKDSCPNSLQFLLENFDGRSCNDGSREPIPVFHNPLLKGQPSTSVVPRTLDYLVGVLSKAVLSWRGKNNQRPVKSLNAVIRLTRSRRRCKE